MAEKYCCEDNGRPCSDPVIVVKMAFIQHLFEKLKNELKYRFQ